MLSRSFKYHRPRGLLTASYLDPGCIVQVGDEPNVRGAAPPVASRDGRSRPQNAWPSLRLDVKAANRLVGRFLTRRLLLQDVHQAAAAVAGVRDGPAPVRPRRAWIRRARRAARPDYDKRYAHPDVLVAGGGPAGMAAAIAAAEAGPG